MEQKNNINKTKTKNNKIKNKTVKKEWQSKDQTI
jgi:hypothetical protein